MRFGGVLPEGAEGVLGWGRELASHALCNPVGRQLENCWQEGSLRLNMLSSCIYLRWKKGKEKNSLVSATRSHKPEEKLFGNGLSTKVESYQR